MSPAHIQRVRELIYECLTALQQTMHVRLTTKFLCTAYKQAHSESKTTESAALAFAEKLQAAEDEDEANKLTQQDREGTRAFWIMAVVHWAEIDNELPRLVESIGTNKPLLPYYVLAAWMIEALRE